MKNTESKFPPISLVYTPIPLNTIVEAVADKVIEKQGVSTSKDDLKDQFVSLERLLDAIERTRPSVRKYCKQKKLRSHLLEDGSPIFLKNEVLEDIAKLPGYENKLYKIKKKLEGKSQLNNVIAS
jgi:hypothetical protein